VVGACHCQAIKFAAQWKNLEEAGLDECACSICLGVSIRSRFACAGLTVLVPQLLTLLQNGIIWVHLPRQNIFCYPSESPSKPYLPDPSLITEYTFGKGVNIHYVCKSCGCQLFEYTARPVEDPRPASAKSAGTPWEAENGSNGSFAFNFALLNDAGKYFKDVHGIGPDGKTQIGLGKGEASVLKGLDRDNEWRFKEPQYMLRLVD
jgi:hypothetical protein